MCMRIGPALIPSLASVPAALQANLPGIHGTKNSLGQSVAYRRFPYNIDIDLSESGTLSSSLVCYWDNLHEKQQLRRQIHFG